MAKTTAPSFRLCIEVGFVQDAMACGHRRGGQCRLQALVRLEMGMEASFTQLHVLTRLSETVKGSSQISPRRDRRAVVGPDLRSQKLPGALRVT